METFVLFILKALSGFLNLLPFAVRITLIRTLLRLLVLFYPKFKKVSLKNLKQVFPEQDTAEHLKIYNESFSHLARLVADTLRLPSLSDEWVRNNVEIDQELFSSLKKQSPHRPVLYATGHLGSFALMAHAVASHGYPLNFIIRNFSLNKIDQWWRSLLELNGNKVIPRKGAVSVLLKKLSEGEDCGVLFDQNVKRNYAVFVDWFGRPAATTFSLGLSAAKTKPHIVAASMYYDNASNKYKVVTELCPCDDIYQDQTMSQEEKVASITARATKLFEKQIKAFPQGWFWMHQRWKTAPEGQKETFYKPLSS